MKIRGKEKHPNGMIYEQRFRYQIESGLYANKGTDIKELAKISNSLSQRRGNRNHQNREEKNMNQIATQPSITEVKQLRKANTQIFNTRSGRDSTNINIRLKVIRLQKGAIDYE